VARTSHLSKSPFVMRKPSPLSRPLFTSEPWQSSAAKSEGGAGLLLPFHAPLFVPRFDCRDGARSFPKAAAHFSGSCASQRCAARFSCRVPGGPAVSRFSLSPRPGNGAPGDAWGLARPPVGQPWDCESRPWPKPRADRTGLRVPSGGAPSEIPSGCEPGGKARRRLPALHRDGHCRTAAPASASRRVMTVALALAGMAGRKA
jgi:hypothetical protein